MGPSEPDTGAPPRRPFAATQPPERGNLLLAVPAVAGAVLLLIVARRGVYLSPDGLSYVGTARNLVEGGGYTPPPGSPPVGNFPPLYPLLLAAMGALGPDPLTVAQFLNPLLGGATVFVAGILVRRLTRSLPLAVAAQLLVLAGLDVLAFHTSALSEPLFLFLTLLSFLVLAPCITHRRPGLLLGGAALAAAACLTRYLGVAGVVAGAAGLAFFGARRWRAALGFALVSLGPLLGWMASVQRPGGDANTRKAVWHPPGGDYLLDGLRSASTWVLPPDVPWPLRVLGLGLVVGALVVAGQRLHRQRLAANVRRRAPGVAVLLSLFAVFYVGALIVDRFLFDATGRLDARFLLPVHVAAVVLAFGTGAVRKIDFRRSAPARLGLSAVLGLQLAAGLGWVFDAARDPGVRPGGFTAPAWKNSTVIDEVRELPGDAAVYTNQVDALFFHTGREAIALPEKAALLTGKAAPGYGQQIEVLRQALDSGGLLVYFTATPARREFLPTPGELMSALALQEVARDSVGVAYRAAPS